MVTGRNYRIRNDLQLHELYGDSGQWFHQSLYSTPSWYPCVSKLVLKTCLLFNIITSSHHLIINKILILHYQIPGLCSVLKLRRVLLQIFLCKNIFVQAKALSLRIFVSNGWQADQGITRWWIIENMHCLQMVGKTQIWLK